MDKFFSLFGKLVGMILIIAGLVGGGVYLGQKYFSKSSQNPMIKTSPSVSVSIAPTSSSGSAQQNPQATGRFAVSAGGASATSFATTKYTLSAIAGWSLTKKEQPGLNQIILTKGAYQLSILQAAFGGGFCIFPGDKVQDMSTNLSTPIAEISLLDGTAMKRGKADSSNTPGTETFDVCQRGTEGIYGMPTMFGSITYKTPLNPDAAIVAEMDAMVSSLQKN